MPELPEVEAIARALREGGRGAPSVLGHVIEEARFDDPGIIREAAAEAVRARLGGARIDGVRRRAKYLLLDTDRGVLAAHLRMTGDLEVDALPEETVRFQRAAFMLSGGLTLRFTDPRRFGRLWLLDDESALVTDLGPEPFDPALTPAALQARLAKTRRALKAALLNQALVAGLGNIWADEALHRARLHPERIASSLDDDEAARLLSGIRGALEDGIEETTRSLRWLHRGEREGELPGRVHLREGAPCPTCGAPIAKIRVAGRSTYLCARCQPPGPVIGRASPGRGGVRPRRGR